MPVSERAINNVARAAIRLLETEGWRRGVRGPGLCLIHALRKADRSKHRWHLNVCARIESIICATTKMRHGFGGKTLIARWNDKPGRTRAEVIAILRRAIEHKDPFVYRDSFGVVRHGASS